MFTCRDFKGKTALSTGPASGMRSLFPQSFAKLGGDVSLCDVKEQVLKSDVLRFKDEEYRLIIHPSGTEPKMKIYLQTKGKDRIDANEKMKKASNAIECIITL